MFVKLQNLDINCFHISGSIKPSPTIRVSVSPLDKVDSFKKHGDKRVVLVDSPNGGGMKRFDRVYRKPHDRKNDVFHDLAKNPNREIDKHHSTVEKIKVGVVEFKEESRNNVVEKMHTKCSTKFSNYGGCIPSILEALETTKDLNEAFKPWEEGLNNKERSIILKEQSKWERALEIFEWFKKSGYEVNVIHYNIMFKILGKSRKWKLIEKIWDDMRLEGIVPINSTYGTLIDVYSKGGCKEEALHWIELMNKQEIEPDEVTMGTVVQMYKKSGEFYKAEQFFIKWSSKKKHTFKPRKCQVDSYPSHDSLSSYTYNTLIDTYGKAGHLLEASRTFKCMLSDGIVPNTITFNTMIHICGNNGKHEEVTSLMEKMEELRCPFDTRTFNILISLHTKNGNIEKAADYFSKMKEARLKPDIVSYRTLLYAFSIRNMVENAEKLVLEMDQRGLEIDEFTQSALTRMYIEAGMLEKSWAWFERFILNGNMSSECCSANIDAFGERGHVLEAEKAFNLYQERENHHSVLEFNVMIKAYGMGKMYDKACRLFDRMDHYGVIPDKCTYNSLIQILASGDLPNIAKPYLRKMQDAKLVNDCIPYCAVISSFVKLGHLDAAEDLYQEMVSHDVQPDIIVYGVLINAFADIGSVKDAIRYVDLMKKTGLQMNPVIYNSLIKLYTKVGYLKEAQETYNLLQLLKVGPDVYSSNCMIDLYSERSMVTQAESIFKKLRENGEANEFSFAMMLCMYKKIGRLEMANRIANEMKELGLLTDLLSFNNVLGLYAMEGRFKEAVEIFKSMIELTIKPDDSTFKSLGTLLVKCGVSKQTVGKLEVVRKKDEHGGLKSWISTLSSVVEAHVD